MKAIILRHAERPKLPSELGLPLDIAQEDNATITDAGRRAAVEAGTRFKGTIRAILTSPVRRCVETAASLALGAGVAAQSISVASFLSADFFGTFAELDELAKQEAVKKLLTGEAVPGFNNPRTRCAQVFRLLGDAAGKEPTLFVTHDWWMALLLANTTTAFLENGYAIWPDFLESLEVSLSSRTIGYRYQTYKMAIETSDADNKSQGGLS